VDPEHPIEEIAYQGRPESPFRHSKKVASKKWWMIGAAIAVGLIVAGGSVYWFVLRTPPAPVPAAVKASSETQQSAATSTEPQTFTSTTLGLTLTYANGWKLKENADKSEIVVTSPKTSYQRADGTAAEGVLTLKLRHGVLPQTIAPTVRKTVAIRDSEVIAYDKPTANQRQYTNISYVGSDANTFNFLMVSGNTALKAGQTVGYSIDLVGSVYLIAGGYGADENDSLVFEPAAKTVVDSPAFAQAVAIIKSLQIN